MAYDKRYNERISYLRKRKEEQTQEKLRLGGYMDEDDYGSIPPPEDFEFYPEFNDPAHSTFYGAKLWGQNFRRLLECHPVYVDPQDALAGRWMFILQRFRPFHSAVALDNMEIAPVFDYSFLKEDQEKYNIVPGIGKMHHFAPDYQIGLHLGWGGLLKKVRKYRDLNAAGDPDKEELYNAEEDVLLGIRNWMERTVAEIRRKESEEKDPMIKENLHSMGDCNEWLIENPPRTYREVCQWISWFNLVTRTYNRDGSGNQLDETLRPYYERDKAAGILTDEDAIFYLACLFISDTHYYQIGGPNREGRDMTSHLSYLILEAAHRLKTSCNLTIRVFDGLDENLFRRGMEILLEDQKGCPRFSGDKALVEGFMKNGFSVEDARDRIAVGCHWMSLPGREYTLNDLIKINIAKVFEVAYWEYVEKESSPTVAGLYELYQEHLKRAILCVAKGIDFHLSNQYKNAPELILNLLSHGPIEKGLDASNGGLEFYNMCVDAAGLATVADSFAALEQRIEREGVLTWEGCSAALRNNFEDLEGEVIRRMLESSEHFGYGGSLGDQWAERISKNFTDLVVANRTPGGRLMIPGLFSWANTIILGTGLGAAPNGRKAGQPISHGANPDPGFRKDGAFTAMAKAIARVQPGYGNTAPFQLELCPAMLNDEDAIDKISAVLRTHFDMGGTLININVLDKDTILEANKDPQKYPDLVVRVTGFTAYFVTLSPEFRQLVVDRVIDG